MTEVVKEDGDGRSLWWIFSPMGAGWSGLRIATFTKARGGDGPADVFVIHNEVGDRIGVRIWADVQPREHWVKVKRIDVPTTDEILKALSGDRI